MDDWFTLWAVAKISSMVNISKVNYFFSRSGKNMKFSCSFQENVADPKSAAAPLRSWLQPATYQSFPLRYFMTLYSGLCTISNSQVTDCQNLYISIFHCLLYKKKPFHILNLTACTYAAPYSTRSSSTSFESSDVWPELKGVVARLMADTSNLENHYFFKNEP